MPHSVVRGTDAVKVTDDFRLKADATGSDAVASGFSRKIAVADDFRLKAEATGVSLRDCDGRFVDDGRGADVCGFGEILPRVQQR
jgi:hypothetical protein